MCKRLLCLITLALFLALFMSTAANAMDPNLIGWWKFNEGSGTTTADATGNGWTGTLSTGPNSPSWNASGHQGYCLNFNDVGTVSVSSNAMSTVNNGVTVAFWQYGNAGEPRQYSVMAFTYGGSGGIMQISLSWDPAGTALWVACDGWSDQVQAAMTNSADYKGQWNYWAFTKNTNTGMMYMYCNAQVFASGANKVTPIDGVNATSFNIGSYVSGLYPYDGSLDDVRLYNKELSQSKLQMIIDGREGFASTPDPADDATGADPNGSLTWTAGDYVPATNGHDVYFGTVFADVNTATTSSAVYKGRQTATTYTPSMTTNRTYYWRIDEVNTAGRPQWKGDVWTFTTCTGVASSTYYVATSGSDGNPGTIGSPFLTITKARDAIRAACALPAGGITVYIRGGNYFIPNTIDFTAQDSGTSTIPIVYRAYPGETPRIIGGVQLDPAWFSVTTNASILARMPAGANGNVYECNLPAHSIASLGQLSSHGESWGHDFNQGVPSPMELLFDGSMMKLACWPNIGTFSTIATGGGEGASTFTYSGTQPQRWSTATTPFACGYWYYDFSSQFRQISSINTATKVITLSPAPEFGTNTSMRWRAYNLLEEIDQAGEYYVETKTGNSFKGMLYFWPTSALSGKEIIVSTLDTPLISVNDAQYITFKGLTLEMGRYTAVDIDDSDYVVIDGCTIRNMGNMGVSVQTGSNCGVQNCEIYGTRQAIGLSGGDRISLTKSYHYARNNKIHDFGRRWSSSYQPGVGLYGVGNEASNNEIYNAPHCGLLFYHNDHLIQYNKIHHVCDEASDVAGMYTHWSWNMRGTDIKYNCVYDLTDNCPTSSLLWGLYIDGFTCEATMFGNIIYNISGYGGIFCQGGRDNDVNNCVITKSYHANCATEAGIGQGCNILAALAPFNYRNPPWSTAYPALAAIPNDCNTIENYTHPDGCRIVRSVGYQNTDWNYTIAQTPYTHYTITNNNTNADPFYVDEANRFLALQDNSPAYALTGFTRIPYEKMGLLDQLKATNPNPQNSKTGISTTADLYWGQALGCTQHTVYFGTNFSLVDTATTSSTVCKSIKQAGTSYDTGTMSNSTTYYWRIDETNSANVTTKGDVWSFATVGTTAPTFVAAGSVASNTTAITPALPGSIANGDILLLFLETSNQAISISNQNGGTWTEVSNSPQYCGTAAGSTGARLTVFWSRYNGSQGAPTTSDSGDHQLGRMIAIRGAAASGNPWDVTTGGVEAASDTSGSIPGATTGIGNTLVVTAIATALPDATGTANFGSWTNANLASLTERIDNTVIAGNGGGLGVATGTRAATGAYGNTAVTLGSSAYKAMMSIAIKP